MMSGGSRFTDFVFVVPLTCCESLKYAPSEYVELLGGVAVGSAPSTRLASFAVEC